LQWRQVRWDLNEIHLPAKKTKADRRRDLPMSQALQAVLQMRRHESDGCEYPPAAAFATFTLEGAHDRPAASVLVDALCATAAT
jgi:hypothetical protein